MEINEYTPFLLWFGGMIVFTSIAFQGVRDPKKFLESKSGRQFGKQSSPTLVKRVSIALFIAGIFGLGFGAWQLSKGTFKWRGSQKEYGLHDFVE